MALKPDGSIELVLPMELTVTLTEDSDPWGVGLPLPLTLKTTVAGYLLEMRIRLNNRTDLHTESHVMKDLWQEHPDHAVVSCLSTFIDMLAEPISQALQDDFTDASRKGQIR